MFKRTKVCVGVLAALGGGLVIGSQPVMAQQAPDAPAAAPAERVEITGSKIRRIDAETAAPVQVITRDQIVQSGAATVGEVLQALPSIAGAATNPQVNNGGGDGASTISLRGLGAERTLLLLDGRRLGSSFDVNSIPVNLIERVDVLKQGAGATYGSDAVGGVVNIITRKNFTGFNVAGQYGKASKGDAKTQNVEMTMGFSGDKGHLVAGINYNKQGEVRSGDRKFSAHALYWYTYDGAVTVTPLGSSTIPQGRITLPQSLVLPDGKTVLQEYGCAGKTSTSVTRITGAAGTSLADFRCRTSADTYDYQPLNLALTPQERASLFVDGAYQVNDSIELFTSVLHNQTTSGFQIAALPQVANNDGFATSANNPFGVRIGKTTAGGTAGTNIQFRPVDLGTRHSGYDTSLTQLTTGARGQIGTTSWNWDLAYTGQFFTQSRTTEGYTNVGSLQTALNNDTFNVFNVTADNPTGAASLVGLQALQLGYTDVTSSNDRALELLLTGDVYAWDAGTIQGAVGTSYRKSYLSTSVDALTKFLPPNYTACQLAAETCGADTVGDQSVKEVYGELLIPLLKDKPAAKAMNLTLGTRYSKYSIFGSTTNSSAKLEYRPVTDLMFRGTWSQVFRAPAIADLFGGQQATFPTFSDPCQTATGSEPGYSKACQYITPGSGYKQDNSQILGYLRSSTALKPESGKVFTLGFVYDSSIIKGFSTSADVWSYRINQAITSPDPNVIAKACLKTGIDQFCNRINRDPGTGQINNINLQELNVGYVETRGVDVSMGYLLPPTSFGRFAAGLDAAFTNSFKYDLGDGEVQQAAGRLDPNYGNHAKLRMTGNLKWAGGPFGVQWNSRYIGGTDVSQSADANYWSGTPGPVTLVHQGGVTYHDLALSYSLGKTGTKFIVGVNNLSDKQPPFAYQFVINGNVDVNTYDTIGRRWFARVEQTF